jgi:hypothetical protein
MTDDQKVESVRADIARIKEEIEWVERAPIPRAEAQTWISDQVDFLAAKGDRVAMAVSHAVLPNGKKFRMLVDLLSDATNAIEMDPSKRCVSIMASMFKDELKANLMTALDAHEYEAGLPQSERPKRLRELREKLLQLECGEEALIEDAEGRGIQIMRRADADPVAVLDYIADGDRGITAETRFTPRLVGMPSQDSGGAAASAGSSQSAASAAASAGHHFPISPAAVGVHGTGAPGRGSDSWQPDLPAPGSTLRG